MRLTCPNCGAQYEVSRDAVPTEGRDVQCSNCGVTWLATPVAEARSDAPPEVPTPRSTITPEIAEILRAEAEREAATRRRGPVAAPPAVEEVETTEPEAEMEPGLALDAAPEVEAFPASDDEPDAALDDEEGADLASDDDDFWEDEDEDEGTVEDRTLAAFAERGEHDLPDVAPLDDQPAEAPVGQEADPVPLEDEPEPAPLDEAAQEPVPPRYDPFEKTDEDEEEIEFEPAAKRRSTTDFDAPRIDSRELWEEDEDEADTEFDRMLRADPLPDEPDVDTRAPHEDDEAPQDAAALPPASADPDEAPLAEPAVPPVPQEDTTSETWPDGEATSIHYKESDAVGDTPAPPDDATPIDDRADDDLDDPALMASLSAEEPDEAPRAPEADARFELALQGRPDKVPAANEPKDRAETDDWDESDDRGEPDDWDKQDDRNEPDDWADPDDWTERDDPAGPVEADETHETIAPEDGDRYDEPEDSAPHDAARQRASMAAASTGAVTRRDLLPDIEEINSSLRSTAMRGTTQRSTELGDVRRGRGFRLGFGTALLIAAALVLIYSNAATLGAALPPLAGPLDSFAGAVNGLRGQLDAWMRGLLAALG